MRKLYDTVLSATTGAALQGVQVLVYQNGTGSLATIFKDKNSTPTDNAGYVTTDANGYWEFYSATQLVDLEYRYGGTTIRRITDVELSSLTADAEALEVAAAASASASAGSATTASNAAGIATNAANTAIAAQTGVLSAISGVPTNTQLPLQALTRTALAAVTGQTQGRQAYLSASGHEGIFTWDAATHAADVTAYPSPATIFIAPASDTSGASGAWVRLVQRPFRITWTNCLGDGATDNTTGLQLAINYAAAQRISEVLIPYAASPYIYTKVTIPLVAYDPVTGMQTFRIRGEATPSTWFGTLPLAGFHLSNSGSILKTTATTGAGITVTQGSHSGYDFNWIRFELKDLHLRTYDNPNITAVDATWAQQFATDNVIIDTGIWPTNATLPSHSTAYGIITPGRGNGAFTRLKDTIVCGHYYGVQANEHTFFDYSVVNCCKFGVQFQSADHMSTANRLSIYRCQTGITFDGPHYVDLLLDVEHAGAASTSGPDNWQQPIRDVANAADYGKGKIKWFAVLGNVGIDNSFTSNGANSALSIKQVGEADNPASVLGQAGNTNVLLTTGVLTAIPLNVLVASGLGHLKGGDNTTFVFDVAGTYRATHQGTFASNATGYRLLELFNATISIARETRNPVTGINTSMTVVRPRFTVAIGDEFQVKAQQTSGGDLNLIFAADSGVTAIEKIG